MKRASISVGDRFGRLVVEADLGLFPAYGQQVRKFRCRCDCGNSYDSGSSPLRAGRARSCGCLAVETRAQPRLPKGEAAWRVVLRSYRANAKNRGLAFDLSDERARFLLSQDCSYCGSPPSTVAQTRAGHGSCVYSGLDRVNNALGYVEGNVVPCCARCNTAKMDSGLTEFLDWVRRVYEHSVAGQKVGNIVRITF